MNLKKKSKKALPFVLLSATLGMVACDNGSIKSHDDNPISPTENPLDNGSSDAVKYNVTTAEELPNCTQSREGENAKVSSEDALYTCKNGRWEKDVSPLPEEPLSSSSDSLTTPLSSSSPVRSSSSVAANDSVVGPGDCFETWYGADGDPRIHTGYDNGSETSGYWYTYGDDADGGVSKIIWQVDIDYIPGETDYFAAIVDYCGGICGTYSLNKGTLTYDPYVGVAFNMAGIDGNGNPTVVDVSGMGGISIDYMSDEAASVELGLGEEGDRRIGYDNPTANLSKAPTPHRVSLPWSKFKQAGWGKEKITGEEASKALASIRFKIQGSDGSNGNFNILGIESINFGRCYNEAVPKLSSSSTIPQSSSSAVSSSSIHSSSSVTPKSNSSREVSDKVASCGHFDTWHGNEGVYRVETGCISEMEDGGYWYDFNDNAEGGRSKIEWPVPPGNEYSEFAMDPIIDHCNGVCGTFNLKKGSLTYNPYAGVAFDVAGTDQNGKLVLADASKMEGICIAYTSDAPATLEMSMGDIMDSLKADFDIPSVSLAKSVTGTAVEFSWSKFKQAGWGRSKITGEEMAKSLASIRFKIQGTDGTSGKFNITSVGPYNGGCSGMLYAY